jgi:hypothetical protein
MNEIPVTRLRVSFEFEATDPKGLELLHSLTTQAPAQFDLKISTLMRAPPIAEAPEPAEDWSKLLIPDLFCRWGWVTTVFNLEAETARSRAQAQKLGRSLPDAPAKKPPPLPAQQAAPAAFDDDKLEVRYPDPLPPPAAPPPPPPPPAPPPAQQQAETPKPDAPKSRAEALVTVANVAQDIARAALVGKTVPVTPQKPADPAKKGVRERLRDKLRALYRAGDPIPGNKELGAELGASNVHIGVALAELKRIEAIHYEWRPDPTPEDETRQRRFVTKA